MHEHDLTDLAMIATSCQRLAARSIAAGENGTGEAVIEFAATSMTALCAIYGISAKQLQARIDELRASVEGQSTGAVH